MTRLVLILAVFALSLSGCAVYGGDYDYPSYPSHSGYSVQYQQSYPTYRIYYDDDERNRYRWHRDRYEDRRHSHYAPGYDGRYQWHDDRQRNDRHEYRRDHRQQGYQLPRQGWYQQHRSGSQHSWQGSGNQRYDGNQRHRNQERERRHERSRDGNQEHQRPHERSNRDDGRHWSISR